MPASGGAHLENEPALHDGLLAKGDNRIRSLGSTARKVSSDQFC